MTLLPLAATLGVAALITLLIRFINRRLDSLMDNRNPVSLLTDDTCRTCFHVHRTDEICGVLFDEPTLDGPQRTVCDCIDNVDVEAESRIVVSEYTDDGMGDAEWADYLWEVRK